MNVVIFIDGSSRPNPGKSGWGAHGYSYAEDSNTPRKFNEYYVTSKGYMDKATFQNHTGSVIPLEFYDFCVHEKNCSTNNAAELHALYRVLVYFYNNIRFTKLKSLTIYTDSEYVRKGLTEYINTWIKNKWKRTDGKDILHSEVWKNILELKYDYEARNTKLEIEWVKGHAGTYGNVLADRLAGIAACYGHHDEDYENYTITLAQEYINKESLRHPFMICRRAYFSTGSDMPDIGMYFLADPGDDGDIGRKMSEALYSVAIYQNPDPVIESIKKRHREIYGDVVQTAMIKLDRVFEKDLYPYLEKFKDPCLNTGNGYFEGLNFIDGRNITTTIQPAGLSMRAMETFMHLELVLRNYLEDKLNFTYTVVDISEEFYDYTEKKCTLKDKFTVGYKDLILDINVDDSLLSVSLCLGNDMPPRNNLKRIESERPVVKLVLWKESQYSFQYAVIIKIEDAAGIWSNYYSNRIMKAVRDV